MNYRSLPRISNSDLTEFRNHLFGYKPYKPVKVMQFGSALHELILERSGQRLAAETLTDIGKTADQRLLYNLANQVHRDKFCSWALRFSRKEAVQLWSDPVTGLPLKSKLDIVHKNRLIVDIKSTSQPTYADFLRSLRTYDYDRQAAFYLDSVGASRFLFVGVQKVKPYNIWIVEPPRGFIEADVKVTGHSCANGNGGNWLDSRLRPHRGTPKTSLNYAANRLHRYLSRAGRENAAAVRPDDLGRLDAAHR